MSDTGYDTGPDTGARPRKDAPNLASATGAWSDGVVPPTAPSAILNSSEDPLRSFVADMPASLRDPRRPHSSLGWNDPEAAAH